MDVSLIRKDLVILLRTFRQSRYNTNYNGTFVVYRF